MYDRWELTTNINVCLDIERAFALLGMMRYITDSCPDDLVLMYVRDTDASGIRYDINAYAISRTDYSNMRADNNVGMLRSNYLKFGPAIIPQGLRKMAKEYMIRCYWDQIEGIFSRLFPFTGGGDIDGRGWLSEMTYPIYARNALNGIFIPLKATVIDAQATINAIYDSIQPAVKKTSRYVSTATSCAHMNDVLTINQTRTLSQLRGIFMDTFEKYKDEGILPDPGIKETFLRLIEILIMYCNPYGFEYAENLKQVYEMTRLGKLGDTHGSDVHFDKFAVNRAYNEDLTRSGKVDAAIASFKFMSPETAICTGRNIALNVSYGKRSMITTNTLDDVNWSYPLREFLKKVNPKPYTEVKLFIVKEIEVQRDKMNALVKLRRSHSSGGGCDCCEPCEGCCR